MTDIFDELLVYVSPSANFSGLRAHYNDAAKIEQTLELHNATVVKTVSKKVMI